MRNNSTAIIITNRIFTPLSNDQVICCEVPTIEAFINQPNPPLYERGLLSTVISIRIKGYIEVTKKGTNKLVQYCTTKDEI